jgi:hypothetical protein
VLTDGKRAIEIYPIAGSGHNDAFVLVYLPAEKILAEADAYTPAAANAPPPAAPNPFSVNLHDNIQRLKLDVRQIAALHGPRITTMADLSAGVGPTAAPCGKTHPASPASDRDQTTPVRLSPDYSPPSESLSASPAKSRQRPSASTPADAGGPPTGSNSGGQSPGPYSPPTRIAD